MLFISTVSAVDFLSSQGVVSVSLINQDPDPAIAGNIVDIRVSAENVGGSAVRNYIVELQPEYPFEKLGGEIYAQKISSLGAFQQEDDQKILKFKVKTDREISEGSYPLTIFLYEEGKKDVVSKKTTIDIDVKNRESAEVIYIDKIQIVPGKNTPLQFTINNVGAAALRDLTFSWENKDNVLLPVGSADSKYIKYLGVGEKTTISYDVIADPNTVPGLYKLYLSLIYTDPITGVKTNITNHAGIYIGGKTDFDVAFSESSNGDTSFSIANIGSNPAYSVAVNIPEQNSWRVSGSNSMIIGNLNKGDYTVASFKLTSGMSSRATPRMPAGRTGKVPVSTNTQQKATRPSNATQTQAADSIKVQVVYTDTLGVRTTAEKMVKMGASTNSTSRMRMGSMQQQSFVSEYKWYIWAIVIILLVYFAYNKYKTTPKFRKILRKMKIKK